MKRFIIIHTLAFATVLLPIVAFAASGDGFENPLAFSTLAEFLKAFLGLVVTIVFPVIVLFIVFIGFRFVQHSASGNAEELKKDRDLLLWAIVGALIVLGAQALSIAIQATVGQLTPQ